MSETEKQLEAYEVDYACDQCGLGSMRPTGVVFETYPPKYPHACTHCGATQLFFKRYPETRYRTTGRAGER